MSRLDRTAAALAAYDAGEPARRGAVMTAPTLEQLDAAFLAEKAAVDLVREAFAEDTSDVNPRDRAFLVHPNDPWLRDQVARHSSISASGSLPRPCP